MSLVSILFYHDFIIASLNIHLYKILHILELISGAHLTVRASKIISGQEPTKTNELLQAIGKSLDKKVIYFDPLRISLLLSKLFFFRLKNHIYFYIYHSLAAQKQLSSIKKI